MYRAVPSGQGSQPAEGPCLSPIPCLHPQNTPMACATASLPCAPHPSRRPRAWPRMPGRSPGSPCVWRSSWARAASERCGWVRNTHPCPHPSQTAQGPWVPLSLIVSTELASLRFYFIIVINRTAYHVSWNTFKPTCNILTCSCPFTLTVTQLGSALRWAHPIPWSPCM